MEIKEKHGCFEVDLTHPDWHASNSHYNVSSKARTWMFDYPDVTRMVSVICLKFQLP